MKNRAIVLVALSPYSENLLRFAYEWSRRSGAEMLLVHSSSVLLPLMTPREARNTLIKYANEDALKKLKIISKEILPPGTSVKYIVSERNLLTILPKLLDQPFNNLLFLGVKKTGMLKKIFVETQAVNVVNTLDSIFMVVPADAPCCAPEMIHVAVHPKYPLNNDMFNKFLRFNPGELRRIVFFSVVTSNDDPDTTEQYLKELTELYDDDRDVSYELCIGDNAMNDLKNVIQKKKSEFIVVQRGSRRFLGQIFRKYMINELVYEGNTPLIIIP